MATVRPPGSSRATPGGNAPNLRLPLRWLVIGILATVAGISAYTASGQSAAILVAVGVATALHKMID